METIVHIFPYAIALAMPLLSELRARFDTVAG